MTRRTWAVGLVLVLLSSASSALAVGPSLARSVADQFLRALPGYSVEIVDAQTLKITKPGAPPGQPVQVNLDRLAHYCANVPDQCEHERSEMVSRTAGLILAEAVKPVVANLRAVVRPSAYAVRLTQTLRKNMELISAPLAGDLVMMCYVDLPTAMRPAMASDLAAFGLTREKALDACRANTRAALPPLPTTAPRAQAPNAGAIGLLNGDPYESSYLLFHADWAPLANSMGGDLLVAAPDASVVLYGSGAGLQSLDALKTLASEAYRRAERPISPAILRWTPAGWEVARH